MKKWQLHVDMETEPSEAITETLGLALGSDAQERLVTVMSKLG